MQIYKSIIKKISSIQFVYQIENAEVILKFINVLEEEGLLNEFIKFFNGKKKINIKRFYLFDYTSPEFMCSLSDALITDFINNNKITDKFLKNLEKELPFNEEEKKQLIGALTDNISYVYDIFAFWVLF